MLDNHPLPGARPSERQIEMALVGSLLLEPDNIPAVSASLRPDDFLSQPCRVLYTTLVEMAQSRAPVNPKLVVERIDRDGMLKKIGGVEFMASTMDGVATEKSIIDEYVRKVAEYSKKRHVARFGSDITEAAMNGYTVPELSGMLRGAAATCDESLQTGETDIVELGGELAREIDEAKAGKPLESGLLTGVEALDEATGGVPPGSMTVLAAHPSVGKSSLLGQMLLHMAEAGHPVGLFSLETSPRSVMFRLASQRSRVSLHRLRQGFASEEERERFKAGLGYVSHTPFHVWDCPNVEIHALAGTVDGAVRRHGLAAVGVDYLQLIVSRADGGRVQQVTEISSVLKGVAREIGKRTGGALIAVSQLSRAVQTGREPQLHHLRDSGMLEADADVALFIWPDSERKNMRNLKIAKQRDGPLRDWQMVWLPEIFRFENAASQDSYDNQS